jgi:hypothetical protein
MQSRSPYRRRSTPIAVSLLVIVIATTLTQVALATGSTVRKFTAAIAPSCVGQGSTIRYTATLTNAPTSTPGQYITSGFFHNPASTGISHIGSFTTPVASGGKAWTVIPDTFDADGFTLAAKSPTSTNGIRPGESVTVTWLGKAPTSPGVKPFSTVVSGSGSFGLLGSAPSVTVASLCPATHFGVTDTSGNPIGTQTAGTAFGIKVSALDANGNVAAGFSGTALVTSTGALTGSPVSVSIVAGVSSPNPSVTITNTGTFTLSASSGSISGTSNAFLVQGAAATHFTVEKPGGGAIGQQTAGSTFAIQVFARDAGGNVAGFTGDVTLTSDGNLVGEPLTVHLTNGVSPSVNVTITNSSSPTFTFSATNGSISGGSDPFVVVAGHATHLVVEADGGGDIGQQASGVPFSIQISAVDANGNVDTGFIGSATISSDGNLTAGSSTGPFINGMVTGHSVTITDTGTFTLTAMSGSVQGTSNAFLVADAALSCDGAGTPAAEFSKSGDAGSAHLALTEAGPNCHGSVPVTVDLSQPGFVTVTKPDIVGTMYSLTVDWTVTPNTDYPLATEIDTGSGFAPMMACLPGPTIPVGQLWCVSDSHMTVDGSTKHLIETYIGTLDVTFKRHP